MIRDGPSLPPILPYFHTARLPPVFLRVYPPQWPEQSAREGRFTSPSMIEVADAHAHARGTARNV